MRKATASPATSRIAGVRALLKKARANPVLVPSVRVDLASVCRRETFVDEPIGSVLALAGLNDRAPHRLQRNTQGRLDNAKKTAYLRNVKEVPTPQHIIQFIWFNGAMEVVDGNHRLSLWSNPGEVCKVPKAVTLVIHYPADETEYRLVYRCIDSQDARKTGQDTLYGVFRAIGFEPESELLLSNKLVSAIKYVANCTSEPDSLLKGAASIAKELQILDSVGFKAAPRVTYSGGVWAGLLSLLKDKENTLTVFEFATHLNMLRITAGYGVSKAAEDFLAEYLTISAPGAQANIPHVVALVKRCYKDFELATAAAKKIPSRRKKV